MKTELKRLTGLMLALTLTFTAAVGPGFAADGAEDPQPPALTAETEEILSPAEEENPEAPAPSGKPAPAPSEDPVPTAALTAVEPASGTCGELTWSLDENGVLTLSGAGEMQYASSSLSPPFVLPHCMNVP